MPGRRDLWLYSLHLHLRTAALPGRDGAGHAHQPPGAQRSVKRSPPPALCQTLLDEGQEWPAGSTILTRFQGGGRQVLEAGVTGLEVASRTYVLVDVDHALAPDGTQGARDRWRPRLLAGVAVVAFCLWEPAMGSDAVAIQ